MGDYDWQKVKEIFNAAVDLPQNERAGYLDRSCVDDAALRANVENLLANYTSDFLELENVHDAGSDVAGGRLRPSDRLKHYEIIRLLGVGGMGEVYLAKDTLLDRQVAIKLLNEKYESDVSNTRRFVQEAKAASALNHPNILTIHEIGETDGSHYIVSEFVEGHRLRTVMENGRLEIATIMKISIQVAEALSAAHAARIIHRDIKPENIVIRNDGYAKVLDFGLAKLLPEPVSSIGLEDNTIKQNQTAKGLILGTVSYMSPEQAKGEKVDQRTDIFSLGVLIYEMITGRTPFAASSTSERFANLINRDPEPISNYVRGTPDELQRFVMRMLRKDPDERYRSMEDLLVDLNELKDRTSGGLLRSSTPGQEQQTAVMERTTNDVQKATTGSEVSSLPFQRFAWVRRILLASLLALVVTGSAIFAALYWRSSSVSSTSGQSRSYAYDYYVRGKVKATSANPDDNLTAINMLEKAVEIDPTYAEAYATLAVAYNFRSFTYASDQEKKSLDENAAVAVEKALELDPDLADAHFARGLLLWTHAKRFPHEQTIQALKRSIELDPKLDEAHHWLGVVYFHIGLLDEAWDEEQKAIAINPDNTLARFRLGVIDIYKGKFEEALMVFKTVPADFSPALVNRNKADALVHLGRIDEANAVVDDYLKSYSKDEGGNVTSVRAVIFAKTGKRKEAEDMIAKAVQLGQGFGHFHHTAYNIASAYAIMHMPDEAMKWLQNAADDGFPCYSYFAIDPNLDNIRKDPRFISFMEKGRAQMEAFRQIVD